MPFRVWLTDIDASIMNHASMMTVFETGRIDLMVRTGFFKLARQKKWYFPTTGISVQFFRPLKAFQKAVLTTSIIHIDEYNIYLEQKITRKEKDIAACLVKSKVKSGRENISTIEIMKLLNAGDPPNRSAELIEHFEKQEQLFKEEMLRK
jgi:acyl-CoA thioesterase FadM